MFAVCINDIVSQFQFCVHRSIVLYADDILLMAPSVTDCFVGVLCLNFNGTSTQEGQFVPTAGG